MSPGWERKLKAAGARVREWWSELDTEQQYVVAMGGFMVLSAIAAQAADRGRTPGAMTVLLRIED